MAIYKIFAKFTAESEIKGEDAERFIMDAIMHMPTGVHVCSVDIEKSENEEEEIGGALLFLFLTVQSIVWITTWTYKTDGFELYNE